jgi:hypothetical protein
MVNLIEMMKPSGTSTWLGNLQTEWRFKGEYQLEMGADGGFSLATFDYRKAMSCENVSFQLKNGFP